MYNVVEPVPGNDGSIWNLPYRTGCPDKQTCANKVSTGYKCPCCTYDSGFAVAMANVDRLVDRAFDEYCLLNIEEASPQPMLAQICQSSAPACATRQLEVLYDFDAQKQSCRSCCSCCHCSTSSRGNHCEKLAWKVRYSISNTEFDKSYDCKNRHRCNCFDMCWPRRLHFQKSCLFYRTYQCILPHDLELSQLQISQHFPELQ